MAIRESRAELSKQREKIVVAGPLVQIVEVWASTKSARGQCNDSSWRYVDGHVMLLYS